jgi:hypothetical protein
LSQPAKDWDYRCVSYNQLFRNSCKAVVMSRQTPAAIPFLAMVVGPS